MGYILLAIGIIAVATCFTICHISEQHTERVEIICDCIERTADTVCKNIERSIKEASYANRKTKDI